VQETVEELAETPTEIAPEAPIVDQEAINQSLRDLRTDVLEEVRQIEGLSPDDKRKQASEIFTERAKGIDADFVGNREQAYTADEFLTPGQTGLENIDEIVEADVTNIPEARQALKERGFRSDNFYMSEEQVVEASIPDSERRFARDVLSSVQDPNSVYDITNFVSVDDAISIVNNINAAEQGTEELNDKSINLIDYLQESYKSRILAEQGIEVDELEEDIALHRLGQLDSEGELFISDELADYAGEFETLDDLRRNLSTDELIKLTRDVTNKKKTDTGAETSERAQDVDEVDQRTEQEGRIADTVPGEEVTATEKEIQVESAKVDTNPTDAQKEAGNYQMGHVNVQGFDITIENPAGSVRSGKDQDGETWETTMNNTYGYIKKTEGFDGDNIDVFLGPNPENGKIYVIDQVDPKTKEFDEHKVMMGFPTIKSAQEAYLSNYEDNWQGLGEITHSPLEDFTTWTKKIKTKKQKPYSEYKAVKESQPQFLGDILKETPKKVTKVTKKTVEPQFVGDAVKDIPPRPTTEGQELDVWVNAYSNDPLEIKASYENQVQSTPEQKLTPLEQEVLTKKVNRDSFIQFSDKANITQGMAKNWFITKGGPNNNIDVIAQDITESTGQETTPDMIVDVILKFPDGFVRKTTNLQTDLAKKYKDITGESITKKEEVEFEENVPFKVKEEVDNTGILDPDDPNIRFRAIPEKNLVVLHNLSEQNVLHADKIGGLPVPSLAVTKKQIPFTGFGEVTLIGDKSLVDPSDYSNRTFAADAYTKRTPEKLFRIDNKTWEKVKSDFYKGVFNKDKDVWHEISNTIGGSNLERDIEKYDPESLVSDYKDKFGFKLSYLNELGRLPRTPKISTDVKYGNNSRRKPTKEDLKWFKENKELFTDYFGTEHLDTDMHKKLSEWFKTKVKELAIQEATNKDGELVEELIQTYEEIYLKNGINEDGLLNFSTANHLHQSIRDVLNDKKVVDRGRWEKSVNKNFTRKVQQDYEDWLEEKFDSVQGEEYFEKGRKKIPYTLNNLTEAMTGRIRGQEESMFKSLAGARAKNVKQFTSLDQIKKAEGSLIPADELDAVKESMNDEFFKLKESVNQFYEFDNMFGALDDLSDALASFINSGNMSSALSSNNFNNVPESSQEDLRVFARKLMASPTQYFESKPQRAVSLNEFTGAVVPKGTSKEVVQTLRDNDIIVKFYEKGGTNEEYYNARQQAVEDFAERKRVAFKTTENIPAPTEPTFAGEFAEFTEQRKAFENSVKEIADEYSKELNSKVRVIKNENGLPENVLVQMRKKGFKEGTVSGAYNPDTGEVFIMTDYLEDTNEAKVTILHELVGHKGLRGVLGSEYSKILDDIYESMPQEDIDRLSELYNTNNKKVIADEYLAEQAEKDNKPNFIQKAISEIKALIRKIFGIKYSDKDIDVLLAKSRDYLARNREKPTKGKPKPKKKEPVQKTLVFKKKPKKKEKVPEKEKTVGQIAREAINNPNNERTLAKVFSDFREAVQDKDLPIRNLEKEIKKRGGTFTDKTRPFRDKNLAFGRVEALWEDYRKTYMEPIYDILGEWKKEGTTGPDVMAYMIAKHAPERNDKIRKQNIEERELRNKKNKTKYTLKQNVEFNNALKTQDFSGVLALNSKEEFKNKPEAFANELVKEFEETHDTKEFWEAVNKSTDYVLDRWLEGNQISKDQFEEFHDDYDYYIPLRGWHEAAAKQLDYHVGSGTSKSLKHAEGRTSLPENPLIYMEQTAFQSIGEQTTNEVNQSMLRLIMKNFKGNTDLFRVKKVYYVEDPITGEFEPTLDTPPQEMFDDGRARTDRFDSHQRLRKPSQASEHEVWVNTDQGTFAMVFPDEQLTVAQALNNTNNLVRVLWFKKAMDAGNMNDTIGIKTIGSIVGVMKALYTSWNIVFPVTNLMRDWPEALTHIAVSGDLKQGGTFAKTLFKDSFRTVGRYLYNNAKFDPKTNELDKAYQEFREAGGQTGFTHSKSPEEIEKSIEKEIKKSMSTFHLGKVTDQLERFSQLFEDASRFAAYQSGIKSGMTQKESAALAKEATVNFNRKGKLSKAFDSLYAFFNVAVQAATKNAKLAKDYPARFATAAASWTLLGGLMAELNRFLDDDEEYEQINEWVRQNYLVFPLFNGRYLRIPLPQFFRSFYSFGTLVSDVRHGQKSVGEATADGAVNLIASLSPIDPGGFRVNGEWSFGPLVPTFIKPVYEISANENFMGGRIYKETFTRQLEDEIASSKLHKPNVNPIIKFMTDALYEAGGGREGVDKVFYVENGEVKEVKGYYDWNPSKVEHFIKGYTGGTGKFVVDLTTTLKQVATPEESIATDNIPYVNAFIRKYPPKKWKLMNQYYDMVNKVRKHEKAMDTYEGTDRVVYREMQTDKGYIQMLKVTKPTDSKLDQIKKNFDKNRITLDQYLEQRAEVITDALDQHNKIIGGLIRDHEERLDAAKRSGNKDMINKIQTQIDKLSEI
jgi:hypothetical protein